MLAGRALALNQQRILLMLLAAVIACHVVLIVPEERYLLGKLGTEYLAYASAVRRWLGRQEDMGMRSGHE